MDPIVVLWFASLAGAAGFTATGVFLGRMLDARLKDAAATTPAKAVAEPVPVAVATDAPPAEPPPEAARVAELEAELTAAREDAEQQAQAFRDAEKDAAAARAELERQLEAVRLELREDIVARTKAEGRAAQLAAQVARIARSVPPPATAAPSTRPAGPASEGPPSRDRLAARAPGLFAEIADLQKEVSRLRGENQTLLAASHTNRRRPPRSAEELIIPDTDALRRLVERVGRIDGVRGVVVADLMGSVLAGAGELLEPIGAFGAYVSDAASRVELLLPLESADEVVVRDRKLGVVSTLRLADPRTELALVMFAVDEGPTREMQQVVARSGLDR